MNMNRKTKRKKGSRELSKSEERVLRSLNLSTDLDRARATVKGLRVDSWKNQELRKENAWLEDEKKKLRGQVNKTAELISVLGNFIGEGVTPERLREFLQAMKKDRVALIGLMDVLNTHNVAPADAFGLSKFIAGAKEKIAADMNRIRALEKTGVEDAKIIDELRGKLELAEMKIKALAASVDKLVRHITELGVQRVILAGDSVESKVLRNMLSSVADMSIPEDWLVKSSGIIAAVENVAMAIDRQVQPAQIVAG